MLEKPKQDNSRNIFRMRGVLQCRAYVHRTGSALDVKTALFEDLGLNLKEKFNIICEEILSILEDCEENMLCQEDLEEPLVR